MAGGGPPSKVSIGASPSRGSEGVGWGRKPIVRLKPAKPLDSQKVTLDQKRDLQETEVRQGVAVTMFHSLS